MRDGFRSNRHRALVYCLRMTFSENRYELFRIMRQPAAPGRPAYIIRSILRFCQIVFKNERVRLTAKDGRRGLGKNNPILPAYRYVIRSSRWRSGLSEQTQFPGVCIAYPRAVRPVRHGLGWRGLNSGSASLYPGAACRIGGFMEQAIQACYDPPGRPRIVSLAAACLPQTV